MNIRIKQILLSTLVLSLTACGGGNSDPVSTPASGTSAGGSSSAKNGTDVLVSGGIVNFKANTAAPDTFIRVEQSDQDSRAFPVISSITSLGADRLAINNKILVTNDEGSGELKNPHLNVIDINSFKEIGRLNHTYTVLALNFASDGTLYIDSTGQALRQIDLSDPKKPIQLRRILTWFTSFESFIQADTDRDNILFQATGVNGLDIWSIETDNDDEDLEATVDDEDTGKLALLSRLAFRDKSKDKRIFPFQVRALAMPDQSVLSEAEKKKKTLLIAARAGGVFVLDVTDPAAPFIRDRYFPKNTQIWDIAIAGPYAYLAAGSQIHILDISDLDNIVPVIGIDIPGFSTKVRVNDGYVTFALADAGVLLHRLTDNPEIKSSYTLIPMPKDAIAEEAVYQSDALYVAAKTRILKLSK